MDENTRLHANTTPALWAKLKPLARQMRHEPTPAENHLWQRIRNRQVGGAKFRRQHGIERFIVDFCCIDARLIVEVDGAIHEYTSVEDAIRQEFLESQGFTVIRFANEDVLSRTSAVTEKIANALRKNLPG